MQFRILGPLEVVDGEHRVEIAGSKQRVLVTVLALEAGRVVSADQLIKELWGDRRPSGGVKSLHFHVFRLRRALQPDRALGEEGILVTRPSGYALMVSPDDVDAIRFSRVVRDARRLAEIDPERAAASLREALGLWRGPFPAELFEAPSTGLEARRLEELRLSALEDLLNAELATGRHTEVIPELEALTQEHPLRERLWEQLMVALYRSDRQTEALRAYQELRTLLAEEMGIDPAPDLRRLEERILRQDPDLAVPARLQRPASLRGYELRERIGAGAVGVVWRASQMSVDREVAVKVVLPEYSSSLGFQAQARLLPALEHPYVVPVFDFRCDPDGAFLVMPLMEGGNLDARETGSWESPRVTRMIEQITSGMAHAHRLGLVHADLHPGNVLFDAGGNAYLADVGLAASLSGGTITPPEAFASPEQVRGEPATPASDVYGLGKLAHRALSGSDPAAETLPPASALRPDVRGAVDTVLRRATDPDPTCRYQDAGEFLGDFRRALGEEPVPTAPMCNPTKR